MIKVAAGICVECYVPFLKVQTRCIFPNLDIDDDLPRNRCRNALHDLFVLPQDHYRLFRINGHSRIEVSDPPSASS